MTQIHAALTAAAVAVTLGLHQPAIHAQPPAGGAPAGRQGGPPAVPAPDPTKRAKLDLAEAKARYKVREQLAGISFPSDAVGTTESVTGVIVLNPDGSVDAAQSKLTVDLRTLKSDQDMRDGFIQSRTLETDKYPTLVFVPKKVVGLPPPLPSSRGAQAGFQLVGDMTLHGVTKEVTWNVVATFGNDQVAGRATTQLQFATFNITKPSLARLMSVEDKIDLEVEFKAKRTAG